MSFSIGIVGLPNVGKSTLFKALTKIKVDIASHPFTTIDPNKGTVQVPDERLEKIAKIVKPEKITPTTIQFIDIAGLVKGAHKGEGLGNQFLAQIRNCDAILEVIRAFENPKAENVAGKVDPQNDIETIKIEFELKDLESKEKPTCRQTEQAEKNLLSKKPIVYLLNTDGKTQYLPPKEEHLAINLKDELEMIDLSDSEKEELGLSSQLDQLILACYNILDLITFFTVAGLKETKAWTLKKGSTASGASSVVHSDFEEKFIRAEVISWQKLVEIKNWKKAKELGQIKTAGKDYFIQDGDVIEFKI